MEDLAQKKCVACEGGVAPLNHMEAEVLMKQLNGWKLSPDDTTITKGFEFKNFADALAFTNKVGAIAEEEGHHPSIILYWGMAVIALTTHAINGLSENDFIVAAKIDKIS